MPVSKCLGAYHVQKPMGAAFLAGEVPAEPGNFAYASIPGMGPQLDSGTRTPNQQTPMNHANAQWAYANEPGMGPQLDGGARTPHAQTSRERGGLTDPYNANARGLAKRHDKKIKQPWLFP